MGGNIDKFCGCNNNNANSKLETSMVNHSFHITLSLVIKEQFQQLS